MKIKKSLLTSSIAALLSAPVAYAGDVEISLPAVSDAFTIDQPAGTELVRVLGNGNVGIGTATPRAGLDVANGAAIPLAVERTNTSGGGFVWQDFLADGQAQWRINGDSASGAGTASLKFSTNDGTIVTPRLLLKSNGNVGISTTNPLSTLHVDGSFRVDNTHGSIMLKRNEAYTAIGHGSGLITGYSPTSNVLGVFGYSNMTTDPDDPQGRFFIQTDVNNDEINQTTEHHFNVTSAGNVGIGTISPTEKLEVNGKIQVTAGNDICIAGGACLSSSGGGGGNSKFVDGTLATDAVYTTGHVGVGTASPLFTNSVTNGLEVSGSNGTIKISHSGAATSTELVQTGAQFKIDSDPANTKADSSIQLFVDGSEKMIVHDSGNVGIGITNPIGKLDVKGGSIFVERSLGATPSSDPDATVLFSARNADKSGDTRVLDIAVADNNTAIIRSVGTNMALIGGNVGIGTTTPTASLHVKGRNIQIQGNYPLLRFSDDQSASGQKNFQIQNVAGTLYFGSNDDNWAWNHPGTYSLVLHNNGNAAFNTGNVGIGASTPSEKLHVVGGVRFEGLAAGSTGNYVCRDNTTGIITHGGSCSASDERLKKDIQPVTHALDKVTQLQGVTYQWKDAKRGTRTELGLIAQAVEKVIPEVVDTAKDEMGTKSIRYENLVALLIEATKTLKQENETLKSRLEKLEQQVK